MTQLCIMDGRGCLQRAARHCRCGCVRGRPRSRPRRSRRRRTRIRPRRCRSSATPRSSNCCAIIPTPILRAAGLGQRNIRVVIINDRALQRLRDGCQAHLRQCRRADGRRDAEPNHRRARARDRPYRRRPLSKLRAELANAQTASIVAMLLGVGAMAAGGSGAQQQCRRQSRRSAWSAPQGVDPCARCWPTSASRRSRPTSAGVNFLTRHRPVRQGHVRHLQAVRRPAAVRFAGAPIPICSRTRCRPNASPALAEVARSRSRIGTRRIRRSCSCATTSCAPSCSASWIGPTPSTRRYPLSDTSLPARYARAVSTYRHVELRRAPLRRSTA